MRAFISQWSPLGALPPTARERVGEASEVASPARDPQAAAIVSGNVCGNYVDSRSYYRTRTRPLEAPPGLSRARQSGVVHRKTTHKTTTPQETPSRALGGPDLEVPAYKLQSIGMRSRRQSIPASSRLGLAPGTSQFSKGAALRRRRLPRCPHVSLGPRANGLRVSLGPWANGPRAPADYRLPLGLGRFPAFPPVRSRVWHCALRGLM